VESSPEVSAACWSSRIRLTAKRKRLLNIVSEMAIASGVPMPEVYVLEQEAAIMPLRPDIRLRMQR